MTRKIAERARQGRKKKQRRVRPEAVDARGPWPRSRAAMQLQPGNKPSTKLCRPASSHSKRGQPNRVCASLVGRCIRFNIVRESAVELIECVVGPVKTLSDHDQVDPGLTTQAGDHMVAGGRDDRVSVLAQAK